MGTQHCPICQSANLHNIANPHKIDEEVDQVLMAQIQECKACRYVWIDKWWEVYTPEGIKIVPADIFGNAIRK